MLYVDIRKRLSRYELHIQIESDTGILGLFGASGAGKSMTLKCIAGIETPDSGVIRLNDRVLYDSEHRVDLRPQERRVGYLFQDYALFPNMTVRQNILAGLHRLPRRERPAKAQALLERFRIAPLGEKRPDSLSGGEKQRVALARLFASSPDLILLDEPFSSLDTVLKCALIPSLREDVLSYGRDCLMVSHDVAEIAALCSRVTTVKDGVNTPAVDTEIFTDGINQKFEALGVSVTACRREP